MFLFLLTPCVSQGGEIHDAALMGNLQKLKLLISKGADVNAGDKYDNTPLHKAAITGQTEAAELLISKGADVNAGDKYDNTPLHKAASNGQKWVAELLIAKGADVNAGDKYDNTPLHNAAKSGMTELAKLLISEGANVNAGNNQGETPLHVAAEYGSTVIVKLLISKGADVNAGNNQGQTPLHLAAYYGEKDTTEELISGGADVNARSNANYTPLHTVAAEGRSTAVVKLLIFNGADVNARTKDNQTPVHLAEKYNKDDIADLLRKHGAYSKRELLKQLTKEFEKNLYKVKKREKVIELALSLTPPPAIPEEAKKEMAKGKAAFKIAKGRSGYEEAEKHFRKAANLSPWWADAYFNLGLVQEKMRDYRDAKESFEIYLLAAPNAPDATSVKEKIYELEYLNKRMGEAGTLINRGNSLYKSKDYEGAIHEIKKAIQLDPDNALAHANLGMAYTATGRYKEAIPELKEALRFGSNNGYIYTGLAMSYHSLGDLKKAIKTLEDGRIYGWGNLGEICQKLGRYYNADEQYEKALESFEAALRIADINKNVDKQYVQKMIKELKRKTGR